MFAVEVGPEAIRQLRRLRRIDAVAIMDALDMHLRHQPDRPSRSRIKRLRGNQDSTYRLRVGEYRVFYDIEEGVVRVNVVLHKSETASFYRKD